MTKLMTSGLALVLGSCLFSSPKVDKNPCDKDHFDLAACNSKREQANQSPLDSSYVEALLSSSSSVDYSSSMDGNSSTDSYSSALSNAFSSSVTNSSAGLSSSSVSTTVTVSGKVYADPGVDLANIRVLFGTDSVTPSSDGSFSKVLAKSWSGSVYPVYKSSYTIAYEFQGFLSLNQQQNDTSYNFYAGTKGYLFTYTADLGAQIKLSTTNQGVADQIVTANSGSIYCNKEMQISALKGQNKLLGKNFKYWVVQGAVEMDSVLTVYPSSSNNTIRAVFQ